MEKNVKKYRKLIKKPPQIWKIQQTMNRINILWEVVCFSVKSTWRQADDFRNRNLFFFRNPASRILKETVVRRTINVTDRHCGNESSERNSFQRRNN